VDVAKEYAEEYKRLELAHNHRNPGMARDFEMTRVTMITSKTNMRGPLITVYALSVLRSVTT
jgi:hypothetical protein